MAGRPHMPSHASWAAALEASARAQVVQLHKEGDAHARRVEGERCRLDALDRELAATQKVIGEKRARLAKLRATREADEAVERKLRALDDKVELANRKRDAAESACRQLKAVVIASGREKDELDKISARLRADADAARRAATIADASAHADVEECDEIERTSTQQARQPEHADAVGPAAADAVGPAAPPADDELLAALHARARVLRVHAHALGRELPLGSTDVCIGERAASEPAGLSADAAHAGGAASGALELLARGAANASSLVRATALDVSPGAEARAHSGGVDTGADDDDDDEHEVASPAWLRLRELADARAREHEARGLEAEERLRSLEVRRAAARLPCRTASLPHSRAVALPPCVSSPPPAARWGRRAARASASPSRLLPTRAPPRPDPTARRRRGSRRSLRSWHSRGSSTFRPLPPGRWRAEAPR